MVVSADIPPQSTLEETGQFTINAGLGTVSVLIFLHKQ